MGSVGDMMQICRLCLVKDEVNVPIFEEQGDIRQIFLKISSCLPVKVTRDDKLPKKICDGCSDKLDLLYEFWNTSANAEKQLLSWLDQAGMNANPKRTDATMSAVAAQVTNKPTEAVVKEEAVDLTERLDGQENVEPHIEDHDFYPENFNADEASAAAGLSATVTTADEEEPPPKRTKRAAALRALPITTETDEDEDDNFEPLTKIEGESGDEDEGEDADPSFADVPSTSAEDQPGPSGVGKGTVEAPNDKEKDAKPMFKAITRNGRKAHQCLICSRVFKKRSYVVRHQQKHSDIRPFFCDICLKRFKSKNQLAKHKGIHELNRNLYKCEMCEKVLATKGSLYTHKRRHEKMFSHICEHCKAGFYSYSEYQFHQDSKHGDTTFVCDICHRTCFSKYTLIRHRARHAPDYRSNPLFECDVCKKRFIEKKCLQNHITKIHRTESDERCICDICGKNLCSKTSLKDHLILHEGLKPNVCEICGRGFANKTTLRLHVRTHTGVKPYECKECGKAFTQSGAHKIHLRYHTGEKPFECELCKNRFVCRSALNWHLKTTHKTVR